jgi:RsiG-like
MPTIRTRGSQTEPSRRRPRPRAIELAHLDLRQLRDYRQELLEEERRISYWRRLVQARIDLAAGGALDRDEQSRGRLHAVLCQHVESSRRLARHLVDPADGTAPLPDLAVLWERGSEEPSADLLARLAQMEHELSAYRRALHARLDTATGDLIARYHADPSLALAALPGAGAAATA